MLVPRVAAAPAPSEHGRPLWRTDDRVIARAALAGEQDMGPPSMCAHISSTTYDVSADPVLAAGLAGALRGVASPDGENRVGDHRCL